MRNVWYAVLVLVLIGVIGFCVKETVHGKDRVEQEEKELFYREQERALMKDTENALTGMGYCHSGITLNRVVEGENRRTYTFTIHHKKIDRMSGEERENLAARLRLLTQDFLCAEEGDRCEFCYEFLVVK